MWGWRVERWDRAAGGLHLRADDRRGPPRRWTTARSSTRSAASTSMPAGTIFAIDTVNERIVRMTNASGHVHGACGERGWTPGEFNWPRVPAIDDADRRRLGRRHQAIPPPGRAPRLHGGHRRGRVGSALGQFDWPDSVAIRQTDRVAFVADTNNDRVVAYNVATKSPLGATPGCTTPSGVDVDPITGHIFVADTGNDRVVELSRDLGRIVLTRAKLTAGFDAPEGVAADAAGHVFVADTQNDRLVVLSPTARCCRSSPAPTGFDRSRPRSPWRPTAASCRRHAERPDPGLRLPVTCGGGDVTPRRS